MRYGGRKVSFNTFIAASASITVAVSFGFCIGYTSPALPDMEASNIFDKAGSSWFGSILTIGAILGCPVGGWYMEKGGRKKTLILASLSMVAGWLFIITGESSINLMYLGRFLTGVGSGITTVVSSVYIAETCTKEMRGTLGTGVQFGITIGIVLVYLLGYFLRWKSLAFSSVLTPLLAILIALRIPETPRWYLMRGRKAEAIQALQWLRMTMDVEEELSDIAESLPDINDQVQWSELLKPSIIRPLQVSVGLMVLQQLGGINVIMFYSLSIFEDIGFGESGSLVTVVLGLMQVFATGVAVHVMDRAGRRVLLILSGLGMAFSCFALGISYHMNDTGDNNSYALISVIAVNVYIISFSIGWGPIPILIMSEVFPVRVRGAASAIACLGNWGTAFLITKHFSTLVLTVGQAGAFTFFGIAIAFSIIFVLQFVPETKGKSLEEIELYFMGRDTLK